MPSSHAELLERLRRFQPDRVTLELDRIYRLLDRLGNPHERLPSVVHVAGTNGKGSTIAFLRAMLEAAGYRVHVYTSPHLVNLYERIRVAGRLIDHDTFVHLLEECERANASDSISYFELITTVAFLAFANTPADFTLLETGLGGRLDATNVVAKPAATIITRISYDHLALLGSTLSAIASEKAGIMKPQVPVVMSPQPDTEATDTLVAQARVRGAPVYDTWEYRGHPGGVDFISEYRTVRDLRLSLLGDHQKVNAVNALAALDILDRGAISAEVIQQGLARAEWRGRLQRLEAGPLFEQLPPRWELWLDSGHNGSAAEALALQARNWRQQTPSMPLICCFGMLQSKRPADFLAPLARELTALYCVTIDTEQASFAAEELAQVAIQCGVERVKVANSLFEVGADLAGQVDRPARLLVCGSLTLVGNVLSQVEGHPDNNRTRKVDSHLNIVK